MADPNFSDTKSDAAKTKASSTASEVPPTPQRCFTGALISGGLAYALYLLTHSIATAFANKPLPSGRIAINIAVAVRTLVIGMSTLGTAIFAIATLGLIALGIQLLVQKQNPLS
jgi:hypothetical protein